MAKTTKRQWFTFSFIVGIFLILLFGLYLRLSSVRSQAIKNIPTTIPKPVKIISPIASDNWLYRELIGRVEGGQTVNVHANVSGWVNQIHFKRDDGVRKGEVILELADERKNVALQEAKFRLEASKTKLKETERRYAQNQTLFKKGIISKDSLDSSKNQLEIEKANTKVLEASYKRVKWNFDNLKIRAAIDGNVIDIIPDVGQEVFEGNLVAKVVNLSGKRLIAGADAEIARLVKTGDVVDLLSNSQRHSENRKGEIVGVSRSSNNRGTYEIEVKILSNGVSWWPGEIVIIKIPTKRISNVVRIPRNAFLFGRSNEIFIFVSKNGKSLKIPIEVTWLDDKTGLVPVEMLPHDCQIIIEGGSGLSNGQEIKVITE